MAGIRVSVWNGIHQTLDSLKKSGAKIFRTDKDGDVTFKFEEEKIIPSKEKEPA